MATVKRILIWLVSIIVFFLCYVNFQGLIFNMSLNNRLNILISVVIMISAIFWIKPFLFYLFDQADRSYISKYVYFTNAVVVLMIAVFSFGISKISYIPDYQRFGVFGDFVGGVLNPFLTFLTFIGLLVTIVIQQTEIKNSRVDAEKLERERLLDRMRSEKQQFEATFFQMLNFHNSIVSSLDVHISGDNITLRGRECFKQYFNRLKRNYENNYNISESERIEASYKDVYSHFQKDLAHYFRFLYNIYRFIDESNFEKETYSRITRSQISDFELALLFYNCINSNGAKFKSYVEKYAIFDNLPDNVLLHRDHRELYELTAFSTRNG